MSLKMQFRGISLKGSNLRAPVRKLLSVRAAPVSCSGGNVHSRCVKPSAHGSREHGRNTFRTTAMAIGLTTLLILSATFRSMAAEARYVSYEAEAAAIVGGQISIISSASGGAAVTYLDQPGDRLEYQDVVAGDWLVIRYANGYVGDGSQTQYSLYVDGSDVATVVFPSTGAWQTFGYVAVASGPVPAGGSIRFQVDSDDYVANAGKICATLDMLVICTSLGSAAAWLDDVKFGDPSSETSHGYSGYNAAVDIGGLGVPCRRLQADGCITFTMRCDPVAVTYLTVKFWGSDTGAYLDKMYLYDGAVQVGQYETDRPEIDLLAAEGGFEGRFYYSTYMLPANMTTGRTEVTVTLSGAPRGVYRAYTHLDPFFVPGEDEPQGSAPPQGSIVAGPGGVTQYQHVTEQLDIGLATLMSWQKYGPDWDAQVAQGAPAVMTGCIPMGGRDGDLRWTVRQWKDDFYGAFNTTAMRALAAFAKAYHSPWSAYYHKPEMVDRVVKGLDFLCVAQGANGSFSAPDNDPHWIGGPDRENGVGVLEGFKYRGFARAFLLLYDEIAGGTLDELIDHDDDPATPLVSRRDAYFEMFRKSRDWVTNLEADSRGHAPNQDAANICAAYQLNQCLQLLKPSDPAIWSDVEAMNYVYEAVGLLPEPVYRATPAGYWISPKGLACEGRGSTQGGYCGNYGEFAIYFTSRLAELTGDPAVKQRVIDAVHAYSHFRYPANDASGRRSVRKEGVITWRNNFYPGPVAYGIFGDDSSWGEAYAALELADPVALRQVQLFMEHGRGYLVDFDYESYEGHYVDELVNAIDNASRFEALQNLPPTDCRLPMEPNQPDFAWADEMAAAVAVKHDDVRMYASLNWRHGAYWQATGGPYDPYGTYVPTVNNIARIHFTTPTVDRIANVCMTTIDGFQGFYRCQYGDYLIGMNRSTGTIYPLDVPAGAPRYVKDLLSAEVVDTFATVQVAPQSTRVLYLGPEYSPGDLNHDGRVDLMDFGIFAEAWSTCTHPADPNCEGYEPGGSLPAGLVGLWTFDQGNLTAEIGNDLAYGNSWCQANTSFGTATIGGETAFVVHVPQRQGPQELPSYPVLHGMSPNGGGATTVNEYTVVMDVNPGLNTWSGNWFLTDVGGGTFDIKIGDVNSQVLTRDGGWVELGPSGISAGNWYRVAFVIDVGRSISLYVDGSLIGSYDDTSEIPGSDNGWFATASQLDLLNNWIGGSVNTIAVFDRALDSSQIADLGAASSSGFGVQPSCEDSQVPPKPADLNGDCYVDSTDFDLFLAEWLHVTGH